MLRGGDIETGDGRRGRISIGIHGRIFQEEKSSPSKGIMAKIQVCSRNGMLPSVSGDKIGTVSRGQITGSHKCLFKVLFGI